MTNAPFAGIDDFRDIESLNHYAEAVAHGADRRTRCWPRCGPMSRDNARTPMQWDDSPSTPASPPARRGSPVNPNHTEINAAAAGRRPGLGASTTTAG